MAISRRGYLVLGLEVLVLLVALALIGNEVLRNNREIAAAESNRLESYKLADELRQTSDDLTRMARTYVVTLDFRYEQFYNQIQAIRDGELPRPINYESIYWDFVTASGERLRPDGETVALEELLIRAGFSDADFALLTLAKERSDNLIELEQRAINIVRGFYPNDDGEFIVRGDPDPDFARQLLHSDEYHRAKAEIMAPIDQFIDSAELRTAGEVSRLRAREQQILLGAIIAVIVGAAVILTTFVLLRKRKSTDIIASDSGADNLGLNARVRRLINLIDKPVVTAAAVVIIAIIGFTLWSQLVTDRRTKEDISNSLSTVLNTTSKAADDWFEERETEARLWSQALEVKFRCQELLDLQLSQEALLNSFSQTRLRELFEPLIRERGYDEFFILTLNGKALAASTDEPIGLSLRDALPERFISRVTSGPDFSTISLPFESTIVEERLGFDLLSGLDAFAADRPLMFASSSIMDNDNRPACLLVLAIDPEKSFSEILQRGRIGDSGETYAFNRSGQLISESRFDDQLRQIGLISDEERGVLNIEIRDPGGDLTKCYSTSALLDEQPLTVMASEAVAGRLVSDLNGYNDYRGVPVVGAWTWDELRGLGIATEIDVDEAFASQRNIRAIGLGSAAFTIILVISLTGLFQWGRIQIERTNSELRTLVEQVQLQSAELQRSKRATEAANRAISALALESDTNKIFKILCKELATALQIPQASMVLLDESGEYLEIVAEYLEEGRTSAMGERFPVDLPSNQFLLREKRPLAVSDVRTDPLVADTKEFLLKIGTLSLLIVPLVVHGQVMGTLGMDGDEPRHFTDNEISLAQNVAGIAGQAIEQAQLNEALEAELEERKRTAVKLEKATNAAEAANRAKSTFLLNMSHELRTPMNAIIGYSEMLAEDADDDGYPQLVPDLEKINSAGRRLLSLINDVLDLSKIEAGRMELFLERFDLRQMLDETVSTVTPVVTKNNNEFATEFNQNLGNMHADIIRVRQSLVNLLSNAAKFTKDGTVTLLAVRDSRAEADWILLTVKDTGIGIPAETFDKVFEEFSQVDESTTRIYGGTGLGLPLSRRFCRMMGGDITLRSEEGKGSTFTIELPAEVKVSDAAEGGVEDDLKQAVKESVEKG